MDAASQAAVGAKSSTGLSSRISMSLASPRSDSLRFTLALMSPPTFNADARTILA
jgi:hypothetical protein